MTLAAFCSFRFVFLDMVHPKLTIKGNVLQSPSQAFYPCLPKPDGGCWVTNSLFARIGYRKLRFVQFFLFQTVSIGKCEKSFFASAREAAFVSWFLHPKAPIRQAFSHQTLNSPPQRTEKEQNPAPSGHCGREFLKKPDSESLLWPKNSAVFFVMYIFSCF